MDDALYRINVAFDEFYANFPRRGIARFLRAVSFPLGRSYMAASDHDSGLIADHMLQPSALRDRLTHLMYRSDRADDALGRMEQAMDKLLQVEPVYERFTRAVAKGAAPLKFSLDEQLTHLVSRDVLTEDEAAQIREYDALRRDAIVVDSFDHQLRHVAEQPAGPEPAQDKAA